MIVCYVRPWSADFLKSIAEEAFPNSEVCTISEHKGVDTQDFPKELRKNYQQKNIENEYRLEEEDDIIKRCRLLRDIPKTRAKKMLNAVWMSLNEMFNDKNIEAAVSPTTDSYIIDLLRIYCEKRSAVFVGLVVSFVDGYSRITSRGEYNFNKEVSQEVIKSKLEILRSDSKVPHYMEGKSKGLKGILNVQFRESLKLIYFFYKHKFVDSLNYHYYMSFRGSKKILSPLLFKLKFDNTWKQKLEGGKINIYLPLQYFPEATIDYWVSNISMIDYGNVLHRLIDETKKNKDVQWIVKEHPAIVGYRDYGFYKKFRDKENVVLVPPTVNSKLLIEQTDITMVWTGTAGFEAAFRGKPVISCGKPFYANEKMKNFFFMNEIEDFDWILEQILRQKFEKNEEDQNQMVTYLMNGLIKGQYQNPKRFGRSWTNNFDQVEQIGKSIGEFYAHRNDQKK